MKMNVYFEEPFWYALIEYYSDNSSFKILKYCFGKEPKTFEIQHFVDKKLDTLIYKNEKIKTTIPLNHLNQKSTNPKRMQRELNKAKKKPVLSTKAQLTLQQQHNALKKEKKEQQKQHKSALREKKYHLKCQKKLQKKKGH